MADYIKCAKCRFALPNRSVSYGRWTAIQCANPESEYHKSLLNVNANGDKQDRITWNGCPYGEACEGSDA